VSDKEDQYARQAAGWSDVQYADARAYLEHRARVVAGLGRRLVPGDDVLDLACGDGGFGAQLLELGFRYRGVDATAEMVAAAERRLAGRAPVELGDLNDYVPPAPVAATAVFRAIYYATHRREFFRRAASYTTKKLVFDLNPRQYALEDVVEDLRVAGLPRVSLRPFFVPQTRALPAPAGALLRAAELSGPLARVALRYRFTYVIAAHRGSD
jgi:SAM-dependent methyltransferase